ncbi:MAG TPA: FG-GAP-like repeat-containing protein [Candidatus Acidoferrum sp.]|nr:FG-GAP-like repeat-containing protein [Candidatus Acidoferrum sp.]
MALSPSSTQTDQGQSIRITATLTNDTSTKGVTWSLNGPGSLSAQTPSSVIYDAPSNVSSSQVATVTATSVAQSTKNASLELTVNPPPQISFQSLPSGTTGADYNQPIPESGGTPPFTWSLEIGALPNGLALNPGTGAISGTPTGGGTWYFWAHVTDAAGLSADQPFLSIEVFSNAPPGNPVPFVNQPLIPAAVAPGGSAFTLTLNGTGFVSGATVNFNGTPLSTAFISANQLSAAVPASSIAATGTTSISVRNPGPGGGLSNVILFPVATPETSVNFSNPPGSPIPAYGAQSVVVSDFNGDGKPDLSVGYSIFVATLLGNGDGAFTQAPGSPLRLQYPPWETLASPYAGSLALGDFNNSGKLGLAVAGSQSSDATILLGDGNGAFTPASTFAYTQNFPTVGLASGDFNGDGKLDLAASSGGSGLALVVLLGYGDGAFNQVPSSPFGLSHAVFSIAVGDFNGDGKLDLALSGSDLSTGAGSLTIFLGNGDGTFTQASNSPMAVAASYSLAVADFNGDGKLDLAVANYGTNTVTIVLGNGDGTFTQATGSPIPVGNQPYAIAAGDFTGNGKLGLAVANFGDNNVSILLGNGDGSFTQGASAPTPVGKGPISLAVGDFNSSGRLGLAVTNITDGTVSILVQQ